MPHHCVAQERQGRDRRQEGIEEVKHVVHGEREREGPALLMRSLEEGLGGRTANRADRHPKDEAEPAKQRFGL